MRFPGLVRVFNYHPPTTRKRHPGGVGGGGEARYARAKKERIGWEAVAWPRSSRGGRSQGGVGGEPGKLGYVHVCFPVPSMDKLKGRKIYCNHSSVLSFKLFFFFSFFLPEMSSSLFASEDLVLPLYIENK